MTTADKFDGLPNRQKTAAAMGNRAIRILGFFAVVCALATAAALLIRGRRHDAVRIAAGGVTAWTAAKALKRLVGRGRPGDHVEDTTLRLGSADHGLGYPSGHAAVAVTLAAGLTPVLGRRAGVPAAAVAGIVGISRIYVGAHYPLDVLGGWALGAVVADFAAAGDAVLRSRQ